MRRAWGWCKAKKFTLGEAALIILLVAGGGLLQASLDNSSGSAAGTAQSAPASAGHSLLNILGGVRESLAAYFWTKTDEIFHDYFSGQLAPEYQLFPYYWMITRLDPHFVMPYYYASWMLCEFGHPAEGLALGIEAARNNPDSDDLQENLAEIYLFFMKDPEKALYHSQKALALATSQHDITRPFVSLQNVIDLVLSGQRKIKRVPFQQMNRINRDTD